ncbi:MAG TPA: hypothetical protein VH796_03960 [Nitrososphaeraceae archaeon]|jgi:hypothetical protein
MKSPFLPGRATLARVEGEMTQLDEFSNNIMLLYGMDGDTSWDNLNTRFLGEVLVEDDLEVEYRVSDNKEGNGTGGYRLISKYIFIVQRYRFRYLHL